METTKMVRKTIQTGSFVLTDKTASGCLDVLSDNFNEFDEGRLQWLLNRNRRQTGKSKASIIMCFGERVLKFTQAYETSSTVHVEFEKETTDGRN